MAVRGWGGSVIAAIGIAAGAGAAQFGLGYGLGIIAWLPSGDDGSDAIWVGNLAWTIWIGATATALGAVGAQRLTPAGATAGEATGPASSPSTLTTVLARLTLAVAASLGALTTVALVAIPARAATRADTFSPQTIAAGHAVVGVLCGLLVALWTLASRAAARNLLLTTGWLWLLAVIAVADCALRGAGFAPAQPGVWKLTGDSAAFWIGNYIYWPGAMVSLSAALAIGAVAAWPVARRSINRVSTAISGGVGPLLVATAYFLAAPRLAGVHDEQLSAHLLAPYGVIVGLAGSVLVTALAQRPVRRTTGPRRTESTTRTADPALST